MDAFVECGAPAIQVPRQGVHHDLGVMAKLVVPHVTAGARKMALKPLYVIFVID
jgi:hypothetical protein